VACIVFAPATGPSVQDALAMPSLPVVRVAVARVPPPLTTAKVTVVPGTGCPFADRTRTAGAGESALPAVADDGAAVATSMVEGMSLPPSISVGVSVHPR
jgi:hypothetical protein